MVFNLKKTISEEGFAFIPQYAVEMPTIDAVSQLGSIMTLEGFSSVQHLRPRTQLDSTPNTYSGNFGTAKFPLHSDLAHWSAPPRYIALRCISGVQEVLTHIFDGRNIILEIGINELRRTLVRPRRPFKNGNNLLLRLLDGSCAAPIFRWDSLFLIPSTSYSDLIYMEVCDFLLTVMPMEISLLTQGDMLIIDNWRMLHGRSGVSEFATNRHIERVYLGEIH